MLGIKAIIFDLYGTLVYIQNRAYPYFELFLNLGLSSAEIQKAKKLAMTKDFKDISELAKIIKPGIEIDSKIYDDKIKIEVDSVIKYPETDNVLKELSEKGIKLSLISNLSTPYKMPFFKLGLDKFFASPIFSCDLELKKPCVRIYEMALHSLQAAPKETLMVGDNEYCDVIMPQSIGINAIHLDRDNRNSMQPKIENLEKILSMLGK